MSRHFSLSGEEIKELAKGKSIKYIIYYPFLLRAIVLGGKIVENLTAFGEIDGYSPNLSNTIFDIL